MKFKLIATAMIAVLLSNVAIFAIPDTRRAKATKKQADRLISLLPASDGVAVFETKRFLDGALPRILSANQPMLAKITGHIDTIRERTAIDVRKFDRAAVGVAYKTMSPAETDFQPVVIASAAGLNLGALLTTAKLGSKGTYRTETVGDKSILIFKVEPPKVKPTTTTGQNSKISVAVDRVMKGLSKEIAVTTIDQNTIVIGTLDRVRETLGGRSHVSADLLGLLAGWDAGVMAFAMRPPGGMAKLLPIENDELGRTIGSITFLAGSMEVDAVGSGLHLLARTKTAGDALSLRDTLEVGQSFGKIAFAGKKRADQLVYARMIESVKLAHHGTDVTVDVAVPQADIDVLVAGIK